MKLFACPSCKNVLYFENTRCEKCNRRLGYLPGLNTLSSLEPADSGAPDSSSEFVAVDPAAEGRRVRLCRNYEEYEACNWAVPAESTSPFCQSCALNEVVPNLETPESRQAWARLEAAKRRLLYSLAVLGLPVRRY